MIQRKKYSQAGYTGVPAGEFTPNWKRHHFKNGEEAILFAIGQVMKKGKALVKKGLGEELTLQYRGNTFIMKGKEK